MTTEEILKFYERHQALLKGHFLLSSGLHSDAYLQSALVMQYPHIAEQIIAELSRKLYDIPFVTVVSPAIGGIRFGYELARQLKRKSVFTERVDGAMKLRRGFSFFKDEPVIIAEDVVTTGKSTKECIDAAVEAGANVLAITCLVDRSNGLAKFDQPFIPLIQVEVKTYAPDECPMCQAGRELVKPGSRVFKA